MLRPEVERHAPWWAWLGAICGAGIGFIIANIPGLMFGMYAGNRLGAIRDAKGKSVAAVFSQLGGDQKAQVACFCTFVLSGPEEGTDDSSTDSPSSRSEGARHGCQ